MIKDILGRTPKEKDKVVFNWNYWDGCYKLQAGNIEAIAIDCVYIEFDSKEYEYNEKTQKHDIEIIKKEIVKTKEFAIV